MPVMPDQDALSKLNAAQTAFDQANDAATGQPWSPELVEHLSYSLLIFTCVAMGLVTVLLWKSGKFSASSLLRIFGIITIIGVSSLLLIAGYSKDQLTPIVGLFGAIAGYLLGKEPSAEH